MGRHYQLTQIHGVRAEQSPLLPPLNQGTAIGA